jgi:hypothetical protein
MKGGVGIEASVRTYEDGTLMPLSSLLLLLDLHQRTASRKGFLPAQIPASKSFSLFWLKNIPTLLFAMSPQSHCNLTADFGTYLAKGYYQSKPRIVKFITAIVCLFAAVAIAAPAPEPAPEGELEKRSCYCYQRKWTCCDETGFYCNIGKVGSC